MPTIQLYLSNSEFAELAYYAMQLKKPITETAKTLLLDHIENLKKAEVKKECQKEKNQPSKDN